MNKTIYTEATLLHQIIRAHIYQGNYIDTINFLSLNLFKKIDKNDLLCNLSIKQIKKILEFIVKKNLNNVLVSSCISITLLAYILCSFSNKKSQIIIGVKIENGKVFSHSWLELENNQILNYFTDYKDYHIIKKFSLEDL